VGPDTVASACVVVIHHRPRPVPASPRMRIKRRTC
jgi:hypothetical protein